MITSLSSTTVLITFSNNPSTLHSPKACYHSSQFIICIVFIKKHIKNILSPCPTAKRRKKPSYCFSASTMYGQNVKMVAMMLQSKPCLVLVCSTCVIHIKLRQGGNHGLYLTNIFAPCPTQSREPLPNFVYCHIFYLFNQKFKRYFQYTLGLLEYFPYSFCIHS